MSQKIKSHITLCRSGSHNLLPLSPRVFQHSRPSIEPASATSLFLSPSPPRVAAMPPLTSTLLSRSTTGSSTRVSAAAAAAISRPAADAAAPPSSRPTPSAAPKPASPFASGLAGRLFGGRRAAARSASSATASFERRFASAGMERDLDVLTWSNFRIGYGCFVSDRASLSAVLFSFQRPRTRTLKS
jgi:hypothetical protein